jgi:hypothetical protein
MRIIIVNAWEGSQDPHAVRHSENDFGVHDDGLILRLATSPTVCPVDYCKNNGQCTFDYTLNRLRCACPSTFTGQFCEVPIGREGFEHCPCYLRETIVLCSLQVNRMPAPVFLVQTAVAAHPRVLRFCVPAKIPTLVHSAYRSIRVE